MAAPLNPSNVLTTVASNGNLWTYTTDNKILTGMDPSGTIVYQHAITNIAPFTQFAINATTNQIYCTTGTINNNIVFVAFITPPPLVFLSYISPSPFPLGTLSYLILSKDDTVLYQFYDPGDILACVGGLNSASLSTISDIVNLYANQNPVYATGITVITQPLPPFYDTITVDYTAGIPTIEGTPVTINPTSVPLNQLGFEVSPPTTLPPTPPPTTFPPM